MTGTGCFFFGNTIVGSVTIFNMHETPKVSAEGHGDPESKTKVKAILSRPLPLI